MGHEPRKSQLNVGGDLDKGTFTGFGSGKSAIFKRPISVSMRNLVQFKGNVGPWQSMRSTECHSSLVLFSKGFY